MIAVFTMVVLFQLMMIFYQIHLMFTQKVEHDKFVRENNEWKLKVEKTYLESLKDILEKNNAVVNSLNNVFKNK